MIFGLTHESLNLAKEGTPPRIATTTTAQFSSLEPTRVRFTGMMLYSVPVFYY